MNKISHPRAGLTLVELLVGLAITSFILIASLSILTDFLKTRTRSAFSFQLVSTSEDVFARLTQDMHEAESLKIEYGEFTVTTATEDIVYKVDRDTSSPTFKRLLRNGSPITSPELQVESFLAVPRSPDPVQLVEFTLELRSLDHRGPTIESTDSTTIAIRPNRGAP